MSGEFPQRPLGGGRGREYRWRSWFLRIFGWDCGYVLTPAVLGHKVYARWAFKPHHTSFGFLLGRDEDGEWGLEICFGPLLAIDLGLPEYAALSGSPGGPS